VLQLKKYEGAVIISAEIGEWMLKKKEKTETILIEKREKKGAAGYK